MRSPAPFIAALLILLTSINIITDVETEGAEAENPDGGGYIWTDSENPAPKVEREYVEIKMDPEAVGHDTPSYSSTPTVDLPFSFPFYETTYPKGHTIYISTHGGLTFDSASATYMNNYYGHRFPSTSSPNALIAAWWGDDYCYTRNSDRLYTLSTKIGDEEVLIIEWNTQQGGKFEVILYEHGMIRCEYMSLPSSQWYEGSVGIENSGGNKGTEYMYNQDPTALNVPLAVYFTREEVKVEALDLTDSNGVSTVKIYSSSQYYIFSTLIFHSRTSDDLLSVMLIVGPHTDRLRFRYSSVNDTFFQLDDIDKCRIDTEMSSSTQYDANRILIKFYLDFDLTYPRMDGERRNLSVLAVGKSAIPYLYEVEDAYLVENRLTYENELVIRDSRNRPLFNNDYVAGKEVIEFTGPRITYFGSNIQPPTTLAWFDITEPYTGYRKAMIPVGDELSIFWEAIDRTGIMDFEFMINGTRVPAENIIVEGENPLPFQFKLQVDTDRPGAPIYLKVYGDSVDEELTGRDNDEEVLVTWGEAIDGESGLHPSEGYVIESRGPEGYVQVKEVPATANEAGLPDAHSALLSELVEGVHNITVRAKDLVGNMGNPEWTEFRIDFTGPEYGLISPADNEWTTSTRPEITFEASDELTGVDGTTLEFRESTDDGLTFGDWKECQFYDIGYKVEVTIRPQFSEGKKNLIQLRGQDQAHSPYSFSEKFPIWVDARPPHIEMVEPEVNETGVTTVWLEEEDTSLDLSMHDWLGSGIDPGRVTYKYSLDGGTTFSAEIPIEVLLYNSSLGYEQADVVIRKDWPEGDRNILLVEAYDRVGRYNNHSFRIRIDTTPEVEITQPRMDREFYDNQTVTFSCDIFDRDGNDDIRVKWISDIDATIGTSRTSEFTLSEGEHMITLEVNDDVHIVRKTFALLVKSYRLLLPSMRDTDGDGMNDSYEELYGLDPERDDAQEDKDGDGFSNLREYYAGTDPTLGSSYPGMGLEKEEFPLLPLILIIVFLVIFLIFGFLFVREIKRGQQLSRTAVPPMPMGGMYMPPGSQGPLQQAPPWGGNTGLGPQVHSGQLQALPPHQ